MEGKMPFSRAGNFKASSLSCDLTTGHPFFFWRWYFIYISLRLEVRYATLPMRISVSYSRLLRRIPAGSDGTFVD